MTTTSDNPNKKNNGKNENKQHLELFSNVAS